MPDTFRRFVAPIVVGLCWLTLFVMPAAAWQDPFAEGVRTTDPLSPEEEAAALHVPEGFQIQLFASEPEIQKPMNLAFDAKGRLWVSGSNDYPYPNVDEPGDSIRILEDTDGDGSADSVKVFVDGITVPIGLYPFQDGVIAFGVPNIWFFRDTDGDDVCDERHVLYGPFDYSRDAHGLNNAFRRGFDGWIYACHGFNNHSTVSGTDGHSITMQSGNNYRFRFDGSRIEYVAHGQVNPFGSTFDQQGDLFTSDCHTLPITLILRDGYYDSFGAPHDGLGYVPPVMQHLHGSTAIAGLTQYTGESFPEEYRNAFLVGNVMTSRVHRDTPVYTGSSVHVQEEPDFVVSDDPWFRPVDNRCGPDGAIYVADFYNRIIGHYEVPLTHPGRDRFRGRIWRIVYVGDAAEPKQKRLPNLASASVQTLIEKLGSANLPLQSLALDQITDRIGAAAIPALQAALKESSTSPRTRINVLWALHRLDGLTEAMVLTAGKHSEELVRIHAMRLLMENSNWTDAERQLALDGLHDERGLVRRAAAAAIGQQPHPAHAEALLKSLANVPADDVHLEQTLKIALRNQLRLSGVMDQFHPQQLSQTKLSRLVEVSLGLNTPAAGKLILNALDRVKLTPEQLRSGLTLAARQVSENEVELLANAARERFANNLQLQASLLNSVRQGLQERGISGSPVMQAWGEELTGKLLQQAGSGRFSWTNTSEPIEAASPWGLEPRNSADGKQGQMFLSSMPGGEQAKARLRSEEFEIPEHLSLWICGHLGFPDAAPDPENFVRICLSEDGSELQRALAPRNDVAQKVEWDLSKWAGQRGYLEVVDGLDIASYAWLAVSRIEPAVASIPDVDPAARNRYLLLASQLVASLGLKDNRDQIIKLLQGGSTDPAVLRGLASTIAQLDASTVKAALVPLVGHPELVSAQQSAVIRLITSAGDSEETQTAFREIIKSLPTRLQTEAALALVSGKEGAGVLLQLIESGAVSARVLQNAQVKQALLASGLPDVESQVNTWLAALPAADAEREALMQELKARFESLTMNADRGKITFEAKCAVCHQIAGKGKVIGPQLDGIGNRGLERLLEDIVVPNRNVDVAFRSRSYILSSGKVYSGIFRRDAGGQVVIADNKGEEIQFPADEIEQQVVSSVSIMPDNWAETLSEQDLLDVVSYLLEQRNK